MNKIGIICCGGEYMDLYDNGYIGRNNITPSGEWKVIEAIRFNNFGHEVERISFKDLIYINKDWFYKNGKQKYHVVDYDHGTLRTWMSPKHYIYIN